MSTTIGIDVGGTFTDVVAADGNGDITVAKVPSTRGREADGFESGVDAVAPDPSGLAAIVHGTTVATNALLERGGARTGLITTAGFGDVLEMRRRDRPRTWGLWGSFEPVIPRDRRLEVAERTLADGRIEQPVDLGEVEAAARTLLAGGCESVCVAFLNSYADDTNEQAAVTAVRELWPTDHVTASAEILPEIREFERTSTAALNAYLQPLVADYLAELEQRLAARSFAGGFLVVQSNGGTMTAAAAGALPVRTALSGPAAGVIAAGRLAEASGHRNIITCDMGGTSFDVAVVQDGEAVLAAQTTVDFGLIIRTPMIEITTIGAGGGSIAHVDDGGVLCIGPASAGSIPGPACYQQGNSRPTVTDAHVVLGRINAESPIGGTLDRLDRDAAREAILHHVGDPLGMNAEMAADSILRVATAQMAGAIRLVSIERGHEPGTFAAMPYGGAGALHACPLVSELGLAAAVVPRYPGVISALGCVIADLRHDVVHTVNLGLDDLDGAELAERLATDAGRVTRLVAESDLPLDGIDVVHELDMSYVGQTHTVTVPFDPAAGTDADQIRTAFERTYEATYGRVLDGIAVRLLSVRTAAIGRRPAFDPATLAPVGDLSIDRARQPDREVWFGGEARVTAVYQRLDLPVGAEIEGPAVLDQPDATVVVDPGFRGRVDDLGNLIVTEDR